MLWFLAAMAALLLETPLLFAARGSGVQAIEWGWVGVMFATLGVAALIAVAGMAWAVIAIARRRERSWMLLLPILLGLFVLVFGIGEAFGHDEPTPNGQSSPKLNSPPTGRYSSHSNASAVEVAPGTVGVSFDYTYSADPVGNKVTMTVSPLGPDRSPLVG